MEIIVGFLVAGVAFLTIAFYHHLRMREEFYRRLLQAEEKIGSLCNFRDEILVWRETYFRKKRQMELPEIKEYKEYIRKKRELGELVNKASSPEIAQDILESMDKPSLQDGDIYPNS